MHSLLPLLLPRCIYALFVSNHHDTADIDSFLHQSHKPSEYQLTSFYANPTLYAPAMVRTSLL